MGRPASREIPRVSRYSGTPLDGDLILSHTGLSPSVVRFPVASARIGFVTPRGARNPGPKTGLGYVRFRSPLLTESMSLSVPAGTEMFQFPAFAPAALCVQAEVTR